MLLFHVARVGQTESEENVRVNDVPKDYPKDRTEIHHQPGPVHHNNLLLNHARTRSAIHSIAMPPRVANCLLNTSNFTTPSFSTTTAQETTPFSL